MRARQLTAEQLLHLVDRVARHVISPAEVELLRAAATDAATAGQRVAELEAEVRRLRAERNEALLESQLLGALSVSCGWCGAGPGRRCVAVRGVQVPRQPHRARLDAVREVAA